ncbi:hypothetical protein G0U57_001619 [Chelydra serpentina]|uniref:Uncharacterized protein n=1 Tax=Chelydra serpentina TaxID=8475 RepID=A0A8T1TF22_CHESE|nr:hypothetical protein G0U57_001619 [Chelydra serpentina]
MSLSSTKPLSCKPGALTCGAEGVVTLGQDLHEETVISLGAFFVTVLVPSGWVLANMENYKKRD